MWNNVEGRLESRAQDEPLNLHLQKIEELKEALKFIHTISDEMSLLKELNQEIIVLRQLREARYWKSPG